MYAKRCIRPTLQFDLVLYFEDTYSHEETVRHSLSPLKVKHDQGVVGDEAPVGGRRRERTDKVPRDGWQSVED
jgi:hypothetical protein